MSVDRYEQARDLAERGEVDESYAIVKQFLIDDPNDPRALVTASYIMRRCGHLPESYHFAKAASEVIPWDAAPWINLGHAASEMWLTGEAESCYRHALKCKNIRVGTLRRNTLLNLSALYIDNGRYKEALPLAYEMLAVDPQDGQALANLGFCQLALREFAEGWKNYRYTLGSEWRPRHNYKGEPEWDGTPGKTVVLYGEQGIGDEISFASMLPDAIKSCRRVIVDCDARLLGLFRRSFPGAKFYGTRRAKAGESRWDKADREFEASLALGQIGEYYRTRLEDFPGTAYLKACPTRTAQWKALWNKPTVGIAWRGGVAKTNARNRQLMLDQLLPVFHAIPARFVSLQYKDAAKEIEAFKERHPEVDLVQYPWATLSSDYDDTAALIASLDYVVCIQTAAAHTAGALGVPVTVLLPRATQWRYGNSEDSIPWYASLKVIRQKGDDWRAEIDRAAGALAAHFAGVSKATGADAPAVSLWHGEQGVCADRVTAHRAHGGNGTT